jgi:hypothetical protein
MPGGDGLALRLAEHGDVDLAVLVVGGAVGLGGIQACTAEDTESAEEQQRGDGGVEFGSHDRSKGCSLNRPKVDKVFHPANTHRFSPPGHARPALHIGVRHVTSACVGTTH